MVNGSFSGVKRPRPLTYSAEVKERVDLYFYPPPRAVIAGYTLNLTSNFQSLAVSLRTARFNIQKFYMVLALHWVFCTDLKTATYALYSINWLVFITVVESVYSTVRTDSLYTADYV